LFYKSKLFENKNKYQIYCILGKNLSNKTKTKQVMNTTHSINEGIKNVGMENEIFSILVSVIYDFFIYNITWLVCANEYGVK